MGQLHAVRAFLLFLLLTAGCLAATSPAFAAEEAKYAGAGACAGCHADLVKDFSYSVHGKAGYWESGFQGCESCHGPGEMHASSGDPAQIKNPASMGARELGEMCLGCHNKTKKLMYWKGSIHERRDVSCTGCHRIHSTLSAACGPKLLKAATEMDTCLCCHADLRMTLFQRSRHPLRDSTRPNFSGNMTCSDCHNPHGTVADKLVDANSINDKCYECHLEKKAPVVWEHHPVKENCLVCHKPHGSNEPNLLVARVPRLCQSCHFQGRHQTVAGFPDQVWSINRGCLNCHPMIHGSNNPSAVKLDR